MISAVTVVEAPRKISWRYVKGAVGTGGWSLQKEGGAVKMTLFTDYQVKSPVGSTGWLIARSSRSLTEDLLRRSMRRFEEQLRKP